MVYGPFNSTSLTMAKVRAVWVLVIQNDGRMLKKSKQYVKEDHKEGTSLIITSEHMLHILKKEILKAVLQKNIFYHEREYYKCQRSSWPRV